MSSEMPPAPESEEPQPRDSQWDEMREFLKVAMEIGIIDVSELTELVNATRNEDLRAAILGNIQVLTQPLEKWRELMDAV